MRGSDSRWVPPPLLLLLVVLRVYLSPWSMILLLLVAVVAVVEDDAAVAETEVDGQYRVFTLLPGLRRCVLRGVMDVGGVLVMIYLY